MLYQDIMKVPGLSGTWQQRNKELYYKLGAPLGSYRGNLNQNMFLVNQLKNNDNFSGGFPGQEGGGSSDPRQGIADAALSNITPTKSFSDVMPQGQWNQVFDEWTRNFVQEYSLPEWQRNVYDPYMEEATRSLEQMNKQVGLGGRRSVGQESMLGRASDEAIKREEDLRTQYQSDVAQLRENVISSWATPLYESQMKRYTNAPWRNLNLGTMTDEAGMNPQGMIGELTGQYGWSNGVPENLESLMGNLGSFESTAGNLPTYDWSAPTGDLSLFNQYKFNG